MSNDRSSRIDRLSWFATRHRLGVLLVVLLVAGIFSYGMTRMKGEVILEEMLPYDHPFLKIIINFSDTFGTGGSWAGISLRANEGDIFKESMLNKILDVDREVAEWEETYRALTFSIGSRSAKAIKVLGGGQIKVTTLLWPEPPKSAEGFARLKKDIFSDGTMRNIVSADGKAAIIQTEFKSHVSYERAFQLLREVQKKYSDDETTLEISGFPVLMGWIYQTKGQVIAVMAVSVGLMILILFLIFRNLIGMAAPLMFGLISSAMGLGFIGWTGINFSPLLYVLAFLVAARMVSHAVQITHRYMEEYSEKRDKVQACYETMRTMLLPNWAGVATDAAGFFILILVKIWLMQQVAIFMTFWMLTVALCGVVTPILCSYMPMRKVSEAWSKSRSRLSLFDRLCMGAGRFSIGTGRQVVVLLTIGTLVFCVWQARNLKIGDPTPGTSLLWPDHPFNQATENMNQAFGASSEDLVLYFKGENEESVYDPTVLTTFDCFDRYMRNTLPDLYKSSDSFIAIMKSLSIIIRDGDIVWFELPRRPETMDGLIGIARGNTDTYTQRLYFDRDMKMSNITVFFTDHMSDNLIRIRKAARDFFEKYPMKIESGEFFYAGGRIGMEIATNEEMKRSHAMIDAMVLGAIFVLCTLFYRSIVAGLMFTLPLILGNMVAFAYMSMTGIGLSINTLPVAAVGVGVGVDFAIYVYNRCIEEFPHHDTWADTIMTSLRTSGKAVVFTGLTMVLPIMVWYFISDLKFQAQMGVFLAIILTTNVVLAITLHPLLIHLIKPRFISRRRSRA